MKGTTRALQAALWGTLCGLGFAIAFAMWDRWRDDLWVFITFGSALGAVFADRVMARLQPSVQLLAIAALLGVGTALATSRLNNRLLLTVITLLGVTGVAAVVNLFAARRPPVVRLPAAVFVATVACFVLIAMVEMQRRGTLEHLRIPPREWPIFAILGILGMAGVPPLAKPDEPA